MAFVSVTTTQGNCTVTGNAISCALGGLTTGLSATVNIIGNPLNADNTSSTATVTASEPDPNLANNSSTVTSAGMYFPGCPDSFEPSYAYAGRPDLDLLIKGGAIVPVTTIKFKGTTLPTTAFFDGLQCVISGNFYACQGVRVTVPASLLTTAGNAQVTGTNPAPGGGSCSKNFPILPPPTPTPTPTPTPNVVQFSAATYNVQEDCTSVTITVNRIGDTSGAATVEYSTSNVTATDRGDYITGVGELQFAAGQTSKTFVVLINEDSYVEGAETLNVNLTNPSGVGLGTPSTAAVSITDDAVEPSTNAIDDPGNFACQQYHDFLNRDPDPPGLAHWTGEITMCSDPVNRFPGESEAQCVDRKRTNTSGAFYLSNEFQNSANFLIRINWGSFGKDRALGRKCIIGLHSALDAVCRPLYLQYMADMRLLTQGIVVNNQLNPDAMNANRRTFTNQFITRADFLAEYPASMPGDQCVDKMVTFMGVPLTTDERAALINEYYSPGSSCAGFSSGRACVLYKLIDGTTTIADGYLRFDTRYGQAYYNQEYNPSFVFIEYLGYLRRNPDQAGYDHWHAKLNYYGNFVDAEMVRSFLVSDEYRQRFGPN
jgi:hypothetical protein